MKFSVQSFQKKLRYKHYLFTSMLLMGLMTHGLSYANDWQSYQNNATQQFEAGQYAEAIRNAEKALNLAEKGQGEVQPYIASSLNMMAMITDAQGNTDQAIAYQQRAIAVLKNNVETSENRATLMLNLARFYDKNNQTDQALNTLQRADQIVKSMANQPQTQQSIVILHNKILSEMQQILLKQNKTIEAQQYAEQQYQLLIQQPTNQPTTSQQKTNQQTPEQNLTTIRALIVILQSYQMQNNNEKANLIIDDMTQRFDQVKAALKPELWQSDYADFLELVARQQQDPEKKKELHLHAIQFYQQFNLDVHKNYQSRLANHYNELGFYYFDQKKLEEAEVWFKRSEGLMQQVYGKNSLEYARLLTNLAQVKDAQAQLKVAVDYYQQAQHIYADLVKNAAHDLDQNDKEHLYLAYAQILNNYAVLQFKLQEYKQAERLWDQGLDISKQVVDVQSAHLLPILENMARLYRAQNRKSDESRVQQHINQIKSAS